jgi:hypothetical protein
MGQVELTEDGRVVFVFPEHPGADGGPTRVPLNEDHVANGPIAGRQRWESARTMLAPLAAKGVNGPRNLHDTEHVGTDHAG